MKLGKFLLGLLLVALIIEIVVVSPKDLEEKSQEKKEESASNAPNAGSVEQLMRGAHLVETREGEKEWELWAESATAYKMQDSWSLQAVRTRIFGKGGVYFTVTGDRGVIEVKSKDMKVQGNVKIRSSNGYVFQTEAMDYRSLHRLLQAPQPVKMWGPKDVEGNSLFLRGQSMEADMNNSLMKVNRDVVSEKAIQGGRRLLIRSQKAVFSGKSNLAHFIGDVVMDLETMRIIGPEAIFEYGHETNLVKSVQVFGGVKVSDLDKWATAQKVNVNFEKDRYVFRGSPRVVQNSDELRGEEIVFHNGGKKVEVFKARAKVDNSRLEKLN